MFPTVTIEIGFCGVILFGGVVTSKGSIVANVLMLDAFIGVFKIS